MANQTGPLGVHGSSLAHEVLFALSGYAGEVIVDRADGSFAVAPSLDYIDASDRTLIDRCLLFFSLFFNCNATYCNMPGSTGPGDRGLQSSSTCTSNPSVTMPQPRSRRKRSVLRGIARDQADGIGKGGQGCRATAPRSWGCSLRPEESRHSCQYGYEPSG